MVSLIIAFAAVILLTGADQLIKLWAIDNLQNQPSKEFIHFGDTKIIDLTYLENRGALFGSFSGMRWLLVIVTAVMMAVCVYFMFREKHKPTVLLCLTLIVSGGLGNIIDRLFRDGAVVDYLEVKLFNFAIFNFADCCVTIGTAILLIYVLFFEKTEKTEKAENG